MPIQPHWTAIAIFCFFFLLVTVAGFVASRWHGQFRRGVEADANSSLDEWGLGGRRFGTVITWFLMGGDLYTAYTMVAVPALVYAQGAPAFFAVPYAVLMYPGALAVLPRFWRICRAAGYVTLADFAAGMFASRPLGVAVAITGILSMMPYIALQLIGMQVVLGALGLSGEWPLIAAFAVLAAYTYSSGLRAPALIAIVKDVMLYITVLAAVIIIPAKLGGFGHIFAVAHADLAVRTPPAFDILRPQQYLPYASLAIGSILAVLLYPHNVTGFLAASSERTVQRNAALLPIYNVLLMLVALLGYMAITAGIHASQPNAVAPLLFLKMFPEWFAGFCLAAVAIGALVPAAIMSIAAANLVTRNLVGTFRAEPMAPEREARLAKIVSVAIKFGALAFVLLLPTAIAVQFQLLAGLWTIQLLPVFLAGLFWTRAKGPALLGGWVAGMFSGTAMAATQHMKSSLYPVHVAGHTFTVFAALPALGVNIAVLAVMQLMVRVRRQAAIS